LIEPSTAANTGKAQRRCSGILGYGRGNLFL